MMLRPVCGSVNSTDGLSPFFERGTDAAALFGARTTDEG
jgi:hypothetical protein